MNRKDGEQAAHGYDAMRCDAMLCLAFVLVRLYSCGCTHIRNMTDGYDIFAVRC